MLKEIYNFPHQFRLAQKVIDEATLDSLLLTSSSRIFLSGMGGSSLPGDIINGIFAEKLHLDLVREYQFPSYCDWHNDFFIIASYSWNTEETISCLEQAISKKAHCIVLSHGGKLERIAKDNGITFLQVPECSQPRLAAGYFFTLLTGILIACGRVEGATTARRSEGERFLSDKLTALEERWKQIATQLKWFLPIIYADQSLLAAARIRKINFNENSKIQAFWNVYPELNHNEMAWFTQLNTNPTIIQLYSKFSHPRNLLRMQTMERILQEKIKFISIEAEWSTPFQEHFWCQMLSFFASYYLALEYGVDPLPVQVVEEFKQLL